MLTYIILALVVALLAGLTGGMPSPMRRPPRSGTAAKADPDTHIAGEGRSRSHDLKPKLPSELLNALSQVSALHALRRDGILARMAGAVVVAIGALGTAPYWLPPFATDQVSIPAPTVNEDVVASAPVDATIVIRLPASARALTAQSSVPDSESTPAPLITTAIVATDANEWPMLAHRAAAARRPATRPRTAGTQRTLTGYTTPPNSGTWLFQVNMNGGASS